MECIANRQMRSSFIVTYARASKLFSPEKIKPSKMFLLQVFDGRRVQPTVSVYCTHDTDARWRRHRGVDHGDWSADHNQTRADIVDTDTRYERIHDDRLSNRWGRSSDHRFVCGSITSLRMARVIFPHAELSNRALVLSLAPWYSLSSLQSVIIILLSYYLCWWYSTSLIILSSRFLL